jgi:tryptophan synthase alpha chain
MTRIEARFSELKKLEKKAFIAYITAGDPSWEKTEALIHMMDRVGVDILELGVPFSDPMADGPVIQQASERALKNNISIRDVLNGVQKVRAQCGMPLLLFTYYNPVHSMGLPQFARRACEAGVDGALITDLTPESAGEYTMLMKKNELNTVYLTAPTTPDARIKKIARLCSGFVYYISTTGVTGMRTKLDATIAARVSHIKELTSLPVAVGFGVSTPEQVSKVAEVADGVVVGSAIVKKIEETGGDIKQVEQFVRSLVAPIR